MELRIGDSGSHVAALQKTLQVEATGVFDQKTRVAVINWQSRNGLAHTGIVNQAMWEALGCIVEPTKPTITFDPDARDGDGDGLVQDGTIFERPVSGSKK